MAVAVVFGIVGCNNDTGDTQGVTYAVTFDVQGHGTAPKTQAVAANGHAVQPKAPTESGWTFEGLIYLCQKYNNIFILYRQLQNITFFVNC